MRHPAGYFALKRLYSHSRESFNLELSSLLFSMDNAATRGASTHLVQPLATFEVPNASVLGTNYYLLFDWAEGTLKDFWKRNEKLRGDMRHCMWMSRQFHGICLAVQCVHNERDRTLKYISSDANKLASGPPSRNFEVDGLYGRHGDIKPDNFLWFHSKGPATDLIALSDFGLARLHTQMSRSNQDPRTLARTSTYIAPEFDLPDGMISRASDIFSLGCVFLEHVTWFLRGLDSVENEFPALRNQGNYDFEAGKFFDILPHGLGGQGRASLKSDVKKWINELQQHENCNRYLYQLLEIIRDKMLEPDRKKRISISHLIEDMELLRTACESNDSFYLKAISKA